MKLPTSMLVFTAWSFVAAGAEVSVSASLSTNRVHVGDRVALTVTVDHPADRRVILEPIERPPFVTVWDTDSRVKETGEGRRTTTLRTEFSSFAIGQHRVATNGVLVLGPDGAEENAPFAPPVIDVESVLTQPPPDLSEIKPPVPFPGHAWLRIAWMILAVLAIGTLLALVLRAWLRRPRRVSAARAIPPHEIALAALEALLKRGLIEQGDAQAFYVELSSIVRLYLEDQFELRAPEQTTEEFIRSSSHSSALSPDHRLLTQAFLEQSDLVKFARHTPGPEDMRAAWNAAARLVRETIPGPGPTPGGAA